MVSRGCPQRGAGYRQETCLVGPGARQDRLKDDDDDEDARFADALHMGQSVAFRPGIADSDTAPGRSGHLTIRPGMWADVCLRLRCHEETPVKVLQPRDFRESRYDSVIWQLRAIDKLVVIAPDRRNTLLWQMLQPFVSKRYYYYAHVRLLGRQDWAHWAWLVDWSLEPKSDDFIRPERDYVAAELDGRLQRTSSSRRRYRLRMRLESGGHQRGSQDAPVSH